MEEEKDLANCLSFLGYISGVEIVLKEEDDEYKVAIVSDIIRKGAEIESLTITNKEESKTYLFTKIYIWMDLCDALSLKPTVISLALSNLFITTIEFVTIPVERLIHIVHPNCHFGKLIFCNHV